jgi:drug/metabolite transporter (DMT)-like permease
MKQLLQTRSDRKRRWFGLLYLLIAGIMLVWGTTWLESYLSQSDWSFLIYWFVCFVTTFMAMFVALLDIWIIRTRARQQRQKAVFQAFNKKPEDNGKTASD